MNQTSPDSPSLVPVVSLERFSGHFVSGGYDSHSIAERLAALFEGSRVLIVVREQQDIIRSAHRQYVGAGGTESLSQFLRGQFDPGVPRFELGFYEYQRIVGLYQSLFGKDKVLVLPYEMLRQDWQGFSKQILSFAGLELNLEKIRALDSSPQNQSRSCLESEFLRYTNRFDIRLVRSFNPAPMDILPLRILFRALEIASKRLPKRLHQYLEERIRKTIADTVGEHYLLPNRELQQLVPWNLSDHGYRI